MFVVGIWYPTRYQRGLSRTAPTALRNSHLTFPLILCLITALCLLCKLNTFTIIYTQTACFLVLKRNNSTQNRHSEKAGANCSKIPSFANTICVTRGAARGRFVFYINELFIQPKFGPNHFRIRAEFSVPQLKFGLFLFRRSLMEIVSRARVVTRCKCT